jgi:hypothetical protein
MDSVVFSSCVLSAGAQDLHVHSGEHAAKDNMVLSGLHNLGCSLLEFVFS